MSNFQLWGVPIITGAVFYILGLMNAVFIKRPKLMITTNGSGGSGSPTGFQQNYIGVQNVPGRLGLEIRETIVFGLRFNSQHWFGWPVMREPAQKCTAWLYDDSGNALTGLFWRDPSDGAKRALVVDINCGQTVDLFLFAQRNDDIPNYYPYRPDADGNPIMPPVKLSGTNRFVVRVMYSDGRQKRDFKYTVTNDFQSGQISIRPKWKR